MKLIKVYLLSNTSQPLNAQAPNKTIPPSNLRACLKRKKSLACPHAEYLESHDAYRIPLFWHPSFTGQNTSDGSIGEQYIQFLQDE